MTNATTLTVKRAQTAANRANATRYIIATANGPRIQKTSPAAYVNRYIEIAPNAHPVTLSRVFGTRSWQRS